MREYMEQQQMAQGDDDGVPTFNIFVRSQKAKVWYPCGALKGDPKATALVNAWQGNFLRGLYKSQLDKGVARFTPEASDAEITELANTRSSRAFMLLGRVAGTFD